MKQGTDQQPKMNIVQPQLIIQPPNLNGDFASGLRTVPKSDERPNYARGLETQTLTIEGPDFARGERTQPPVPEGPDYARSLRQADQ
jgi:hypothetical protein